jgi:AraC-like DNA-binding protein
MDVLSELLAELRVESTLYCRFAVAPGYGVAYPASPGVAGFHVVTAGELVLATDDGERRTLSAGDFVVLAHGAEHRVLGSAAARAEPVAPVAARAVDGLARVGAASGGMGGGEDVCGAFHFAAAGDHPLLSALPAVLHVREAGGAPLPWLRTHLDAVACESRSGRPGGAAMIARLSELLFVQAIRWQLAELPAGARGWLGALRDPGLARAVALIHRHPERAWTVAARAREAGLSRSQFAERFAATVGRPPLTYLAEWRMHRGRALLRDGGLRVGEVARRVGYASEAAFSTAFRRTAGVAPGAYRRGAAAV